MLFVSFLVSVVVGFGISIPPGPISVAVIKQGLRGDMRVGMQIGLGAAMMDVLYALLAAFASSALVKSLKTFVMANSWFELAFQLVCIVVLIILGWKYFHSKTEDLKATTEKEKLQEEKAQRLGFSSPILVGVLIAITNLANPPFLPTLIGLASLLQGSDYIGESLIDNIAFALGFGTGVLVWFTVLLRLLLRLRDRLPASYFTYIFKFAGLAFFLFAVIISVRVVIATDWAHVF